MKKSYVLQTSIIAIALILTTFLNPGPKLVAGEKTTTQGMDMRSKAEGAGMKAKAEGTEVRIENFVFTPGTITIPVNSAVTWVNKDDIPHVIAGNGGLFKSRALDTDQNFSYIFTKAGTYRYYCSLHPKMTGTIVVR